MTAPEASQLDRLKLAAEDVRKHTDRVPKVALVLGSGLGAYADSVEEKVSIPYTEIRGMSMSKVEGHAGNLVLGTAEGVSVAAMQGRVHLYEGHPAEDVVFGLRLMLHLGAKTVIITNAAGGIGDHLEVGDLMLIEDQLNLTGRNPLVGVNEDALGPRFVDMTTPFDEELRGLAEEGAKALGFGVKRGVYAGLLGPTYETPAEIRMLKTLGGDAVGMSTVLEVVAARHMGARVLGISCITNKAAGLGHETLDHEEVQEVAKQVRERFVSLLGAVLRRLL
ncbi:MAG TPA: purine-nucleoside phosphorylase [Polyangiaceae bacterium LLY-WYZ-15_(1-7)]|mgnify:CR=1 FL=1|nr:purine-nucleoside phosphorylase [Myxococcales bacterium]MAT23875.1 purine-nucleoside phosphorylase [Sandaracinus sp.]HJK92087.1 purine-nucleoside phosphorylase [Polyangiaceae bacterium LLY-WYZ-15_(1-7)]MBJ71164.1 purine-nucleoside phosphorylase [Sandaracinus sp.]HJL00553.1 purine-nucleoside phosphorylase [Polyangiaceae bacterium LLY-WYZ-15_(1-7)]